MRDEEENSLKPGGNSYLLIRVCLILLSFSDQHYEQLNGKGGEVNTRTKSTLQFILLRCTIVLTTKSL